MHHTVLLAGLSDSLVRLSGSELTMILGTVAAIGAVWVVLYYWDVVKQRERNRAGDPQALFDELCEAHGIARAEREALLQVVITRGLRQPASVFVDPRHLRESGNAVAASLAARLFGNLES